VTHVVALDGVGEQDARVVRARTAGVPVLDLADGDRLLAGEAPAGGGASETVAEVVGDGGGRGEPEAITEEREETAAEGGASEAALSVPGAGDDVAEAGDREQPAEDPHRRVVSLVRPRAEFAPEVTDIRPSDVFTDSALEAVLHFPSLQSGDEVGDGESVVGACGCGGDEAGMECVTQAGVEGPAGAEGQGVAGVAEVEKLSGTEANAGRWALTGTAASVAWALLPLVSIGLLAPVGIGYAAYRLRSRVLSVAAVCYTLAVAAAFAVSAVSPVRTGRHALTGELLLACVGVSWLGGTVHSFLIRRRVFR
jgi:hypothetical protein